jgi:hypothetical protein
VIYLATIEVEILRVCFLIFVFLIFREYRKFKHFTHLNLPKNPEPICSSCDQEFLIDERYCNQCGKIRGSLKTVVG